MSGKKVQRRGALGKGGSPATEEMRDECKRKLLQALAEGYSSTEASRRAGISRSLAYQWRHNDEFREAWEAAQEEGTDRLEDEMVKRALSGSDTLLIFALKARRRSVYGDLHAVRVMGYDGGAVKHQIEDTRPGVEDLYVQYSELFPEMITHEEK